MGVGTAVTEKKHLEEAIGSAYSNSRSEACGNAVEKGCFWIQAARGFADWMQSDAEGT